MLRNIVREISSLYRIISYYIQYHLLHLADSGSFFVTTRKLPFSKLLSDLRARGTGFDVKTRYIDRLSGLNKIDRIL